MGQYWYLWLFIIILIPITVFVCYKAAISSKKRKEQQAEYIAFLEEKKALKDEFQNLDENEIKSANDDRLLAGMALILELKIEKAANGITAFNELSEIQKNIFVIECVLEDMKEKLSDFFKKNTVPITPLAEKSFISIGEMELSKIIAEEASMFDENNEVVSIDYDRIKQLDDEFSNIFNEKKIRTAASAYIKANATEFNFM